MFYPSCFRSFTRPATHSCFSSRAANPAAAFTLLELLLVIALLAGLTAAMISTGRRATQTGATARARSELAVLRLALEEYRRRNGDFPRTGDAALLLQALLGRQGPLGAVMTDAPLVELSKFKVENAADPLVAPSARLVDPWGQPYVYCYRTALPWTNAEVVLYSVGPDGLDFSPLAAGGYPQLSARENLDNIYVGGATR